MSGNPIDLVFSDLDGTLLDHHTYSYRESLPGIELLKKNNVPLVPVSSKTFPEMIELHRELDLRSPFVFENGGGIAYPRKNAPEGEFTIALTGMSAAELEKRLPLLREILGRTVQAMSEMALEEIMELTGFDRRGADMAKKREASMPFILGPGNNLDLQDIQTINRRLARHGLIITRGGRFYHFSSAGANKGEAVLAVINYYRNETGKEKITSLGIGDSENDIPLLQAVTVPALVRKPGGGHIESGLDPLISDSVGPAGFTRIIETFFRKRSSVDDQD